jgi:pimeloyl-ACP methyl ester carboxylesterase
VLKLPVIARTDDFFELGGTSLQAVEVILEMEKVFGVALPPSTLVERSTIAELAVLLTDYVVIPSLKPLVMLREGGAGRPLFLIHSGQGDVTSFGLLARRLPGRMIYGFQSVGMQGESWPLTSVEAMADRYLPEILEKDPTGPYLLGATCMGGMVALEMAKRLVNQGREVALLAFFDVAYYMPRHKNHDRLERIYGPWRDWVRDGCRMLRWAILRTLGLGRSPRGLTSYRRFVAHMNSRAYRRYQPGSFPGEITMFNTVDTKFPREDLRLMMQQFAHITRVISLPGKRATLYSMPAVDELARQLQKALEMAEGSVAEKSELSTAVRQ